MFFDFLARITYHLYIFFHCLHYLTTEMSLFLEYFQNFVVIEIFFEFLNPHTSLFFAVF